MTTPTPFQSSTGLTVYARSSETYPFMVVDPAGSEFLVNTLADECSCAAIQGIACDHKAAVDEYVEAMAKADSEQETAELPAAAPTTMEHRPKYNRRQVGTTDTTPARPLWATDVECSCGHKDEATGPRTKDEAKELWKAHRDAATDTTPAPIYPNREAWLMAAVAELHAYVGLFGYEQAPQTRVACGFTYGKGRRIGECWRKEASGDGTFEIIVHNKLDNPVAVLECLIHEVGHTFMEKDTGHKAPFRRFCKAVGLAGKPTATVAGPELLAWIKELAGRLGTYPHAALDSSRRIREGGPKKQTNRWLKWVCEYPECGWVIRTPKANFRGVCVSELHQDTPALFVPAFTTEPSQEEPEGPEEEV